MGRSHLRRLGTLPAAMGLVALAAAAGTWTRTADAATTGQSAAADAYGGQAQVSVGGNPPIVVGPVSPSGATEPGGPAASQGNLVNCGGCLAPVVASAGAVNTSSLATLSSAPSNCVQPGFPVQGTIALDGSTVTGGSACASIASVAALRNGTGDSAVDVVDADAVQSQSVTQSCTAAPAGHAGIVGLSVLGHPIPLSDLPVNPPPNTDLGNLLPGADPVLGPVKAALQQLGITIILNEQHPDNAGHGMTVNAIHVIVANPLAGLAGVDLVLAHSHSEALCGSVPPTGPCPGSSTAAPCPTPVITKTDSTQHAAPGDTVTYTVSIDNKGCPLTIVTDILPPGFRFVPPAAGPLGSPTVGNQPGTGRETLTWENLGGFPLTPNPVVETLQASIGTSVAAGTYVNDVDVTSANCGSVHGSDAGITVSGSGPTPTPGFHGGVEALTGLSNTSGPSGSGAVPGMLAAAGLLVLTGAGVATRRRRAG